MKNENINHYFSPNAPIWLKDVVLGAIEQAQRDAIVEAHDTQAGEHYRAHILKDGTDKQKADLQRWDAERKRDEQFVEESCAKTKLKQQLLDKANKKRT